MLTNFNYAETIDFLNKTQKNIFWKNSKPKKYETLSKKQEHGFQNFDLFEKTVRFHCSWVQRLFDHIFRDLKVM